GRPQPLDAEEPRHLAETIALMKLSYVVVTSVDRDDLRDGGAGHFVACIRAVRELSPGTKIEILTPDFRGRLDRALGILHEAPPDVMNHNLETVMRDLRAHGVDMLTVGQYLQPSKHHLPVARFAHPDEFRMLEEEAGRMGFVNAACGPMVRSSYHADRQASEAG